MEKRWQLEVFGTPELRCSARAPVRLVAKDAALLAHVALNPGVASARAAALVWPGCTQRQALNNLRQRLYRLRKTTGARLLEVDDHAVMAPDLALGTADDAAALEQNAGAWDAEFLGELDYGDCTELQAWVAGRRLARAQQRRDALAGLASAAESRGELARARQYAERLLADEPLSEHAHRRLMRLHYLRGDTAAAVAAFETCERTLRDEFGLKPSAETIALLATIERGRPHAGPTVAPTPTRLLRPPVAVGRDVQRQQLADAHAARRIAVLVGEAGMGKTRLLQDHAAARADAVYAQARPGDATVPYAALARLLGALALAVPPAFDDGIAGASALEAAWPGRGHAGADWPTAARLQKAVEDVLVAALVQGVRLLIVDDLQFADRATVELLADLAAADRLHDMRWACAHRPSGPPEDGGDPLQPLIESSNACLIELAPLQETELTELIESLDLPGIDPAALAPSLGRHTGGNPLYVLETLRALQAAPVQPGPAGVLPRPSSIAQMIDRRLRRLSERALNLGRVAALAGADFSPPLAEHALATPALQLAGAWAELEAADVLRGNAFAHDLVRDGMLRATPSAIAVHAHRLIAQYLEEQGAEPARVAAHWAQAEAHREAAAAYARAAERARQAGRPREHAELLEAQAQALDALGADEEAVVVRSTSLRSLLHARGIDVADVLSRKLLERHGTGPQAGLVWARRASLMMQAGQAVEAERCARQALELLTREQHSLRAEASAALAVAWRATGQTERALDLLQPWIAQIDTIDDVLVRIELGSAQALLLYHHDRLDEAAAALERQVALVRSLGQPGERVPALLSLSALHLRRGNAARALQSAHEAAAEQIDYDEPGLVPGYTRFLLGSAHCAEGRYGTGLALLESAVGMIGAHGAGTMVHSNAESAWAEVLLQIGQPARALALVAQDPEALGPSGRARRLLARAAIHATLGRPYRALLDEAMVAAQQGGGAYWQALVELERARLAGDDAAAQACANVMARARRNGDHAVYLCAAVQRLERLRAAGRTAGLADEAFDVMERLDHGRSTGVYRPRALLVCGRAYAAAGQRQAADHCLALARAWIYEVALPNVPDAFRDAYLHRCQDNLDVQAEVARRAGER